MNEGDRHSDNIEFQFATKFKDLNEMSTMVALTSGANAADLGINKLDCAREISRSMTSEQMLRETNIRRKLFSKFERGRVPSQFVSKRKTSKWMDKRDHNSLQKSATFKDHLAGSSMTQISKMQNKKVEVKSNLQMTSSSATNLE